MPESDPSPLRTIAAAVEAILPGDGDTASASALGVQRHVFELADRYLAGFTDVMAALLDAYAMEAFAAPFADLGVEERRSALRAFASEEAADVRDVADALFAFTYGGMYSEWTGFDRDRRVLSPPAAWARLGYGGPSRGYPDFAGSGVPTPHPHVREIEP